MQGRRLSKSVKEDLVGVAIRQGEFQIMLTGLLERAGAANGGEKFGAGTQANGAKNIVAVVITP